ncbi:MAG: DNA lyase, partial [Endomicrobiia bacterium]
RFHNNKAKYLVEARDKFTVNNKISIKEKISSFKSSIELRQWLIENIKGIGYKEASHFLRNIGLGLDLAILDRHILKNLKLFEAIDEIPQTLTPKKYLEIEEKMKIFCKKLKIPMSHMDLLMWCMQTGGIFK